MKSSIRKFFLFAVLSLGASYSAQAACTQTLSPGANVAGAVSSAATGATICLNSGSYGTVNLNNISRTGFVTVQSASGRDATISPQVGNSKYIRLSSLTISGAVQSSCSRNIEWTGNTMTGQVTLTNSGCSGSLDTVFDGNTFASINVGGGYEGRLSLIYGSGITVKNNTFGPGGSSDGIFMGGNVSSVTIGPGNKFTGILEAQCGTVHCDSIQGYGAGGNIVIKGNLFEKGDTFIMMPDGSSTVTVQDNVFNGSGVNYDYKIQFGSAANLVYNHNTNLSASVAIASKSGEVASTNAVVKDNIMASSSFLTSGNSGCSNCTVTSNLMSTPTFVGGTVPTSWAGWALAPGSVGVAAASDGLDMGANIKGITAPVSATLIAPTNLVVF